MLLRFALNFRFTFGTFTIINTLWERKFNLWLPLDKTNNCQKYFILLLVWCILQRKIYILRVLAVLVITTLSLNPVHFWNTIRPLLMVHSSSDCEESKPHLVLNVKMDAKRESCNDVIIKKKSKRESSKTGKGWRVL